MPTSDDQVVQIKGLAECMRALDQFPIELERRVIYAAERNAMKIVVAQLARNTPVQSVASAKGLFPGGDPTRQPGDLLRSIRMFTRRKSRLPTVAVSIGNRKVFYANIVEVGAKAHTIVVGKRTFHHPGFPGRFFVRKTYDETAERAVDVFGEYVLDRTQNEWDRLNPGVLLP